MPPIDPSLEPMFSAIRVALLDMQLNELEERLRHNEELMRSNARNTRSRVTRGRYNRIMPPDIYNMLVHGEHCFYDDQGCFCVCRTLIIR